MLLSIIIPALNEEERLAHTLDQALQGKPHEIIVVDGQSRDRTAQVAAARGARVVFAPPGRGTQMNAGAAEATGDTLLFLHADTLLPVEYQGCVVEVLGRPGVCAGAFRLRIDSPRWSFRVIERGVDVRSRLLQRPYGDQAMFLRTETFARAGGFRDLSAMEDYELTGRLRRLGRIDVAQEWVTTSPRRWLRGGIWRTTLLNQVCVAGFKLGVPAQSIASWRGTWGRGEARGDGSIGAGVGEVRRW